MKKNDTLFRHWRMLREIPRYPKKIGTVEILERIVAAGFDSSLRTVQRDLIKLSAALPLIADDAKPQGWSWQANAEEFCLSSLDPLGGTKIFRKTAIFEPEHGFNYSGIQRREKTRRRALGDTWSDDRGGSPRSW